MSVDTPTRLNIADYLKRMNISEEFLLGKKIGVAMSGGVDSSTVAALFKTAGANVTGLYMKNWSDPRDCRGVDDRADALKVALKLGIPFHVFDFEKEYREKVIDYFYQEYESGRTPNPDIMCNKEIKFKIFLDEALKLGLDYIATGHYAGVRKIFLNHPELVSGSNEIPKQVRNDIFRIRPDKYELVAGIDQTKDQSYFLYTFTQEQLARVLLPLGNFYKKEIREIAKTLGVPVHAKPDSQGICFVGEVKIREFLSRRLPKKTGEIKDLKGKVLGTHDGIYFYTLGQREGLKIGGGIPYYVVDKKVRENILVVAPLNQEDKLYSKSLTARDTHWVSGVEPEFPLKVKARIRHLQALQDAVVNKITKDRIQVEFEKDQRAISPGQSVVLYAKNVVLGGGIIS